MAARLDTLVSYVSPQVARLHAVHTAPPTAAHANAFPGAALFADISGFTSLTERLAQLGATGAEQLTQLLNTYFGRLVDVVSEHGGEVAQFAGDGLLAVWPANGEDLAGVTLRAAQCGVAVQTLFRDYEVSDSEHLELTIAVGAGELVAAHVGGVDGRWEYVVAGAPLAQMALAEVHAQPGNVVLAPEAWALVQARCVGHPLPTGAVRLQSLRDPLPLRPAPVVNVADAAAAALRCYVPLAVLHRLDVGHTDWLAELRRVTVLFLSLRGLAGAGEDSLDDLQTAVETIQTVLARYEGAMNKVLVDDRGTGCLLAFGLPPLTHEDDASRAVQAAMAVQAALRERGMATAIGIASGQAFCGPVGGERRREYTMIGDVVNVAARLMQEALDEIWCDESTYHATEGRIHYDVLPRAAVKGKATAVDVYRPIDLKPAVRDPRAGLRRGAGRADRLVGRHTELDVVAARLGSVHTGTGGALIIQGDAGIGKSRLVAELVHRARDQEITCFEGAADAVENSTPYYSWRPVFTELLNIETFRNPRALETHLRVTLEAANAELPRLLPLLNGVLPLSVPENEVTAQMTGDVRADNTQRLLCSLIKYQARLGVLAIVLEDVQWMDSASWALAMHISRDVPEALLVLAGRPFADGEPPEFTTIARGAQAALLRLEPLGDRDAILLVCQRLGVDDLAPPVAQLICERAQGNPFFSEELAYALRDAGHIRIENRVCTVAPESGDLTRVSMPDTVQGVVTSRIDRLSPAQQLALKAASVIGRVFTFRALYDIYPIDSDRPMLHHDLDTLDALDLTPVETPEPDLAYIFKHVITQEVAYNLMLETQRQNLHRATAEWYEREYVADLSPYYSVLAHHWAAAQVDEKALHYRVVAGEAALERGVYKEARHLLRAAQALDDRMEAPYKLGAARRAMLERCLGEAALGLGHLDESRQHLEAALALHGVDVPTGRGALVLSLLRQMAVQALHRLWPHRFLGRAGEERDRVLESVRALLRYCEILYFRNQILPALHFTLVALNRAERAGPSPELARTYAGSALFAGATPFKKLAHKYAEWGWQHARRVEQLAVTGYVGMATGAYAMSSARYAEAHRYLTEGIEQLLDIGDYRRLAMCRVALARVVAQQGDFEAGLQLSDDMIREGRHTDNVESEAWGLIGTVENSLRLGRPLPDAVAMLERAAELLAESGDTLHRIRAHGMLGGVHLLQGQRTAAHREADTVLSLAAQAPPAPGSFEGYAGALEVFTEMWRDGDTSVLAEAEDLAGRLRSLGKRFPLVEARAHLWQGHVLWLKGKHAGARKAWSRSLAAAERYESPYEQALAQFALGSHGDPTETAARTHLERACELFERVGAVPDLARAHRELGA